MVQPYRKLLSIWLNQPYRKSENMLGFHPDYPDLYITKHKETGTTYIGAIVTFRGGTVSHVDYELCLLEIDNFKRWKIYNWGTQSRLKYIQEQLTKPELYTHMDMETWYWHWRQLEN